MKVQSWTEGQEVELLPCPCCGGEPELLHKGNDYRRKKEITIKCTKCHLKRTDAALRHDFGWLEKVGAGAWNKRANEPTT